MYRLIAAPLLFVLFFVFLIFIFGGCVAIFARLILFVFLIIIVVIAIFGDDVEVHGMDLRHFQFGFTLWATQDLPLFHFVFIDIDLGRTLGAADHGSILRKMKAGLLSNREHHRRPVIIYRGLRSQLYAKDLRRHRAEQPETWMIQRKKSSREYPDRP